MVLLTHLNYIVPVLKALCGPEEYLALPQLCDGTPDLPELHCTSLEGLCGPEEYPDLSQLWDGTPDLPELHCTSLEGPVWS